MVDKTFNLSQLSVNRTEEEILERIEELSNSVLPFEREVLYSYLSYETLDDEGVLKDDVSKEDWDKSELSAHVVVKEMEDYMDFAIEKAENKKGNSATRSIMKYSAWLWLLGDDKGHTFVNDDSNYEPYGKPCLEYIQERYSKAFEEVS